MPEDGVKFEYFYIAWKTHEYIVYILAAYEMNFGQLVEKKGYLHNQAKKSAYQVPADILAAIFYA